LLPIEPKEAEYVVSATLVHGRFGDIFVLLVEDAVEYPPVFLWHPHPFWDEVIRELKKMSQNYDIELAAYQAGIKVVKPIQVRWDQSSLHVGICTEFFPKV